MLRENLSGVTQLFIGNDHPIPQGGKGNDPIGIRCNVTREAADGFSGGSVVMRVERLSVPEHIVNDQHTAATQFLFYQRQRLGISFFINIIEY